jgi:hypothetical protein
MDKLTEHEKSLLELTREHIRNEKQLIKRLEGSKLEPINLRTTRGWFSANLKLEEKLRELLAESDQSLKIHDSSVRDQLIKIRDRKSETKNRYDELELLDDPTLRNFVNRYQRLDGEEREKLQKLLGEILNDTKYPKIEKSPKEIELREEENDYLDDMIHYLMEITGYSGDFHDRKKDFGTIIVNRSMPPAIDTFLQDIKIMFLLNQFEAVIGFSRTLLEIACEYIFSNDIPEKYKQGLKHIDGEFGAKQKIREACKYRLKFLKKSHADIDRIKELAETKYGEASDVLHGKLQPPKTEYETLNFVKEIFSIIEALY